MVEHPDTPVVQMDSVIGRKGGKVLLTIFFQNCNLLLAFLRDHNTARSVTDIFEDLYSRLGHDDYCKLFPVILTDRGSEFSNPTAIEKTLTAILVAVSSIAIPVHHIRREELKFPTN